MVMKKYHKIQSLFKRNPDTHKFIEGEFSLLEFEYLQNNIWVFTEKIDGTNIRINWDAEEKKLTFGGRTDNAQLPTFLYKKLQDLFVVEKFESEFPEISICLYGEGYGAKIQKGGDNYISDGVDFILFDVMIDGWWLLRENIEDIANNLKVNVVPIVGRGDLNDAVNLIKSGLNSTFGDFQAEGIVLKPEIELFTRNGMRIITKLKHKDFIFVQD